MTQTIRKMRVSPDSRIDSANSFGVFCRSAPSTSAIIRSMKVEPGCGGDPHLDKSDSTVVPPVTAERSPPASRMTGADSPVIADSLTEATPSTISPSPGMISPASTSTTSPTSRSSAFTPSTSRRGFRDRHSAWRACRCACAARASACALPRPSATASAKLANSTVNQSQAAIWPENEAVPLCAARSRMKSSGHQQRHHFGDEDDRVACTSARGSSLRNASTAARGDDLAVEQALRLGFRGHGRSPIRRSCRRASGSARRSAPATAPGNIAAGRE